MAYHRYSHFEERNFHCNECPQTFKSPHILRTHKNTVHSDICRYECAECGKKFKRDHHLVVSNQRIIWTLTCNNCSEYCLFDRRTNVPTMSIGQKKRDDHGKRSKIHRFWRRMQKLLRILMLNVRKILQEKI